MKRRKIGSTKGTFPFLEMGIFRENLSAIVMGNNLLPIIAIAQKSFDSSISDIAFVIACSIFRYRDKRFLM